MCKGYLTTSDPARQTTPGGKTRILLHSLRFVALFRVLFGELLEECLYAVGCGPLRGRKSEASFLTEELVRFLQHPSSHHPLLKSFTGSTDQPHSISMRSRRWAPEVSGGFSGLTSSPTPFSVSKPALRKCPAARTRRSPGTRT